MVEFRDVVKKYAGTDEALGVPAGTVGGIPVVTPDDLGPAAAMTPAEVVTDEDAQAALSATFGKPSAWRPGWLSSPGGVATTSAPTVNVLVLRDLWVPPTGAVIDLIAAEVVTGAEGASLRLCIYGDDDDGQPGGSPIVATGPLDASTTGVKQVSLPNVALPGGIVWVGAVAQGASPTIRTVQGVSPMVGVTTTAQGGAGYYHTGVTGDLPDPFTPGGGGVTHAPRVFVRAAS